MFVYDVKWILNVASSLIQPIPVLLPALTPTYQILVKKATFILKGGVVP